MTEQEEQKLKHTIIRTLSR